MQKKYRVRLTADQRARLERLTSSGTIKVRQYKRARVLLLADEAHPHMGKSDEQIAAQVEISPGTAYRVRRRFVEEGLEAALTERPRPGKPRTFNGVQRAQITALACSEPPAGYARWSLRLLADKVVELGIVDSISHDTVGEILKKTNSSHT
jgi:transposase